MHFSFYMVMGVCEQKSRAASDTAAMEPQSLQ